MDRKRDKPLPECAEGKEAFQRFDSAVSKLLSVPKAVLLQREAEYRAQVDANPRRRGPKRKTEIQAEQAALAKAQAEKQAIDNALVDVRTEILKRKLEKAGRRKRTR